MEVITIDVSPLNSYGDTASYLVITDRYNVLIETGPSCSLRKLYSSIEEEGLNVNDIDMIFVTHIHLDHAGASGYLVSRNNKIKLYVHPRGYPHMLDVSKLWLSTKEVLGGLARVYGPPKSVSRKNLVRTWDGMEVDLGEDSINIIFTPGHASHHMAFYFSENRYLFPGDAAGLYYKGVIVPITPKPHNPDKAIDSLDRIMELKIDATYFTHYSVYRPGYDAVLKARDKWDGWRRLFKEFYNRGYDVDVSYQKLLENDIDARIVDEYYKERGFGGDELRVSVEGMLSYFEWLDKSF
jgi:glyoxylase-like metal-dependent hydrolase (beta-lactamase superfamily II)